MCERAVSAKSLGSEAMGCGVQSGVGFRWVSGWFGGGICRRLTVSPQPRLRPAVLCVSRALQDGKPCFTGSQRMGSQAGLVLKVTDLGKVVGEGV